MWRVELKLAHARVTGTGCTRARTTHIPRTRAGDVELLRAARHRRVGDTPLALAQEMWSFFEPHVTGVLETRLSHSRRRCGASSSRTSTTRQSSTPAPTARHALRSESDPFRSESDPSQIRIRYVSDPSQIRVRSESDTSQIRVRSESDPSQIRVACGKGARR